MAQDDDAAHVIHLHELIPQKQLLERYPWLSARRLAEYRRAGRVRWLVGKDQEFIYPLCDLELAINADLEGGGSELVPAGRQ